MFCNTETKEEYHSLFLIVGFVASGPLSLFPSLFSMTVHLFAFSLQYIRTGRFSGFGWWSLPPVAEAPPTPSSLLALPLPHQGRGLLCPVIVPVAPGLFAPTFLLRLTTHDKPNRTKPNPDFSQEMFFWGTKKLPPSFLRMAGCYKLLLSRFHIVSFCPVLCP